MENDKEQFEYKRYSVKIFGVVQGVGYRPYVYNQAKYLNINGWVSNEGSALVMDIEGRREDIKEFMLKILKRPPSLAVIQKIKVTPKTFTGYRDFRIKPSSVDKTELKFIPNDVGTCPECLKEIFDPDNQRYQYPFTNCTSCGPRYSIIKELPYDRARTTMKNFKMCPTCQREYDDPGNRRFHAQPNCCPTCGPGLQLLKQSGEKVQSSNPVVDGVILIKLGKILAIKGLGGFHLVCDAQNRAAIEALRTRKNRPHKPFAIMVKDMETARKLCHIGSDEERILSDNKRPIVLLENKGGGLLPDIIAPKLKKLGIMLPYTPLHYLLFQQGISYLIMTSGNQSSSPIQYDNNKAVKVLGKIADYFLIHNREIHTPVEDSVVKVLEGREVVIRRARGYAPYAINMKVRHEVMALGAEQKNTFCFSQNGYGYLSQYLGDLKDFDAYTSYEKTIDNLTGIMNFTPKIASQDLNYRFLPNQYERNTILKKISVQHHHAHMASCMVEHNLYSPVIGVIFDGTGLGSDGSIWGGEFFVGTRKEFIRTGHLEYVFIQGGDQAIKEPWRIAVSYLHSINNASKYSFHGIEEKAINTVIQALENRFNCYKSSSMGRFFDCIAALLNIRLRVTYEAQAAIELESILDASIGENYDFHIKEQNGTYQISYASILKGVLKDIESGVSPSVISAKFHNAIGLSTLEIVYRIGERYGIRDVVLSGGVFENSYLLRYILKGMREKGLRVYYNQQIPINDGGISVGQLAIADALEGE